MLLNLVVTPVIATAPVPPPLRVQFLQSINDERSPLVRGYAKDDAIFVRVPDAGDQLRGSRGALVGPLLEDPLHDPL